MKKTDKRHAPKSISDRFERQRMGRPAAHDRREILNATAYVLRSGCAERLMPHDLPPWSTVYHYFRQWHLDGTGECMNGALREKCESHWDARQNRVLPFWIVTPSKRRKKGEITGRKRYVLVDTVGRVSKVLVFGADPQNRIVAP